MKEFIFYYDVVCPFAYVASRVIERLAGRLDAKVIWKPVLLGGLYQGTKGDSLSPILDQSAPAKLKIIGEDLQRTMHRNNVKSNSPSQFPRNSLYCMRLLAAASQYSTSTCINLTHRLYKDFWINDADIAQLEVLENAALSVGWKVDVNQAIGHGKELLWENVKEALDHGAFGVPSFWVNDRLYYGVDRLHFLEKELGNTMASPLRLAFPSPSSPRKAKLTIFYDFASPWAYIGSTQIPKLLASVSPIEVEVEWVPILVGVLFKSIGTPMIPMQSMSEAKRNYGMKEIKDWTKYLDVPFHWTMHFPLKTVLASRICIFDGDDRLRQTIYEAAWRDNMDISNQDVLRDVLNKAGFNADKLIQETQSQDVKDKLRTNTQRAIDSGVCGVPSYQVNEGAVLWGQDRLNVVADMICGWQDMPHVDNVLKSSKL